MEKLNSILDETLKIAEKTMQTEGFVNPKVIVFYRDEQNELSTYMVDLAPQSYFDDREGIMKKVGLFLAKQKGKGIRSFDTLIYVGESNITIGNETKQAILATALTEKGESATKVKEIQKYIMFEHPEKQFFNLQDLKLAGLKYKSPVLSTLLTSLNSK